MPRRRRRLRRTAQRVLRAGAGARLAVPRRQPRSRRGRDPRDRGVQPRRGRRRGLVTRAPRRGEPVVPRRAPVHGRARRDAARPRQPAGSGLGVRAQQRRRARGARGHRGAARPRRAQPRRAGPRPRRRAHRGRARGGRHGGRPRFATLAAEPGLGRPAARRRPSRRLAPARPHAPAAPRSSASTTTSRRRRPRSARPGCPSSSPRGWRAGASPRRARRPWRSRRRT